MRCFSVLDHFLLSGTLFGQAVRSAFVVHDTENTSDHKPVILNLSLQTRFLACADRVHKPRIAWTRAGLGEVSNYREQLSSQLQRICVPTEALLCTNVRYHNMNHVQVINVYACSITDSCISAAESMLPHTCSRKKGCHVPGLPKRVKPLKEKSLFWHRLWTDCGRPRSGTVAECIRMVRKNEERIVSEQIATAMLSSDRNFWEEVKRIRLHSTVFSSTKLTLAFCR